MDYRKIEHYKSYTNIRFIDNSTFHDKSISMYSTFKSIDLLLTDFSSIYIDFLLLDRPMAFVFSDYNTFKKTRGFLFSEPINYMPGEIITTPKSLELFLMNFFNLNTDKYSFKRKQIKDQFHKYERDFSQVLFKRL